MFKTYVDHLSENGFYFHHTMNAYKENRERKAESHTRIEFLYLVSGSVDYHINGSTYHIHPGDIIIVNPQELHSLDIRANTPYERIVLQISPELIPTFNNIDLSSPFLNAHLYEHIIPKQIVNKTKLVRILTSISNLLKKPSKYTDVEVVSKIIAFISEINRAVDILTTKDFHLIPSPKSSNALLQEIIRYVNKNLDKNYTIAELARIFNMSESYMHRFFKSHMNITLYQYISNQKLQCALSMLNQGHPPQYVSDYLGYEYYTTFYTQFKKKFNKPPKAVSTKLTTIP